MESSDSLVYQLELPIPLLLTQKHPPVGAKFQAVRLRQTCKWQTNASERPAPFLLSFVPTHGQGSPTELKGALLCQQWLQRAGIPTEIDDTTKTQH